MWYSVAAATLHSLWRCYIHITVNFFTTHPVLIVLLLFVPVPLYRRRFSLYEPVEFIRHFLLDKLEFSRVRENVAVHIPCSSKKMGIEESFMKVGGVGWEGSIEKEGGVHHVCSAVHKR
jgi:hypothetical protein